MAEDIDTNEEEDIHKKVSLSTALLTITSVFSAVLIPLSYLAGKKRSTKKSDDIDNFKEWDYINNTDGNVRISVSPNYQGDTKLDTLDVAVLHALHYMYNEQITTFKLENIYSIVYGPDAPRYEDNMDEIKDSIKKLENTVARIESGPIENRIVSETPVVIGTMYKVSWTDSAGAHTGSVYHINGHMALADYIRQAKMPVGSTGEIPVVKPVNPA